MSKELIPDDVYPSDKYENNNIGSLQKIASQSVISSSRIKSTNFQIFSNLFKTILGVGILSLSYGYKEVGIILANTLMIICLFFTFWSLRIVIKIVDHMNMKISSISQLIFLILGKWGFYLGRICVFICQVGLTAVYVSFFGIFLHNIFCYVEIDFFCSNYMFNIILCLILIIPLSLVKTLTKYNSWSTVANSLLILALLIIFSFSIKSISDDNVKGKKLFDFGNIPSFFGISVFAIECVGIVLELRESMSEPQNFEQILLIQFIIVTLIYTILPTIFYMGFGESTKALVIFNISISTTTGLIVQILYTIGLCVSFPLQLFPIFLMIEGFFNDGEENMMLFNQKKEKNIKKYNRFKIYVCRIILVMLIVTISYVIPEVASFINMIGAIGFTCLGMIFPVVLGEVYLRRNPNCGFYPTYSRIINFIGLCIGTVGGVSAFVSSIKNFIK